MTKALIALAAAVLTTLAEGAAEAQPTPRPAPEQCFRASDWRGWKATEDASAMYIDAGINRVYRLDLSQPCPELNALGARIVQRTNRAYICRPIDLFLRVVRPSLSVAYCPVGRITRLSRDEIKALPRTLRP